MNLEAVAWLKKNRVFKTKENPFLSPDHCQLLLDEIHRKLEITWSYGGWMEDRRELWRGTYLQEEKKYLHVGVDLNVGVNTQVAAPWPAEVLRVDADNEIGGWGGRIVLKPLINIGQDCVYILAHLKHQVAVRVGEVLAKGQVLGEVGEPEVNGGWFSHLHVQAVNNSEYQKLLKADLVDLDGYVLAKSRAVAALAFPDPLSVIGIK